MTTRPTRLVIVGRDAALWLTAAALRQALAPAGICVVAIELPSRLTVASIHVAQPALEALHAKLGIDEAMLLRATGGSFSLGYNIVAAERGTAPFFLAHGGYGTPVADGDFFGHWLKARHFGLDAALEDFSPTAMAARHGRVMLPDAETETFGRTDYGYHLPAISYATMLKGLAHRLGVTIRQTAAVSVDRDPASGRIDRIRIDGGGDVEGDLFIDASGEAVLIGKALGIGREDWRRHFPFDRRLIARGARFASIPVYGEIRRDARGWTGLYAGQAATHVVRAYRAAEEDDGTALAAASAFAGLPLDDAIVMSHEPGRRIAAWSGNCVAIGGAACTFDAVFDLELHAIQLGIVHLLALFPAGRDDAAERAEYNRITASTFDRIRDFQAAFHALTAAAEPPEPLAHRLAMFRARGIVAPMEDDGFTTDQWRALLVGLGVQPESWPPAIDTTPPEHIRQALRDILGFVRRKVLEQPVHDRYLADVGGSEAA